MGGINLGNARIVCQTLGLKWDRDMMVKILTAASAYLETKQEQGGR